MEDCSLPTCWILALIPAPGKESYIASEIWEEKHIYLLPYVKNIFKFPARYSFRTHMMCKLKIVHDLNFQAKHKLSYEYMAIEYILCLFCFLRKDLTLSLSLASNSQPYSCLNSWVLALQEWTSTSGCDTFNYFLSSSLLSYVIFCLCLPINF